MFQIYRKRFNSSVCAVYVWIGISIDQLTVKHIVHWANADSHNEKNIDLSMFSKNSKFTKNVRAASERNYRKHKQFKQKIKHND